MSWEIREKVYRKGKERDFVRLRSNHKKKKKSNLGVNELVSGEEFNKSDFIF